MEVTSPPWIRALKRGAWAPLPTPSAQGGTHRASTQLGRMDEDALDKMEGPLPLARLHYSPAVL